MSFFGKDKKIEALAAAVKCIHERLQVLDRIENKVGQIEFRQIKTEEMLSKIMATISDLEQAVQGVISSVAAGFQGIDAAVTAAADRVIASINAGSDPAAQIAELEALKGSISTQTQAEVDKLNAIDPAAPAAPTEIPAA